MKKYLNLIITALIVLVIAPSVVSAGASSDGLDTGDNNMNVTIGSVEAPYYQVGIDW